MALPRLAVLSVLSAASSPCPDLNLIHYSLNLLIHQYRTWINLFRFVGGRLKIWFPSMKIGNSVYFLNKKLKNFALSFQKRYTPCGIESRVAVYDFMGCQNCSNI